MTAQTSNSNNNKQQQNKGPKKGSPKTKVDPSILKQRREAVEQRILKLEGRLNKDRALLVRYAQATEETQEEQAPEIH